MITLILALIINISCYALSNQEAQELINESKISIQKPFYPQDLIPTLPIDPITGKLTTEGNQLIQNGFYYSVDQKQDDDKTFILASIYPDSKAQTPVFSIHINIDHNQIQATIFQLSLPPIKLLYTNKHQLEELIYINPKTHKPQYSLSFQWENRQISSYTSYDSNNTPLFLYTYTYSSDGFITTAEQIDLQSDQSYVLKYTYDTGGRISSVADDQGRYFQWNYQGKSRSPYKELYYYHNKLKRKKIETTDFKDGWIETDLYKYSISEPSDPIHYKIYTQGQNNLADPVHTYSTSIYLYNAVNPVLIYGTDIGIHIESQTQYLSSSNPSQEHYNTKQYARKAYPLSAQKKPSSMELTFTSNKDLQSLQQDACNHVELTTFLRDSLNQWCKQKQLPYLTKSNSSLIENSMVNAYGKPLSIHYSDGSAEFFKYDIHGSIIQYRNQLGYQLKISRDDTLRPTHFYLIAPNNDEVIDFIAFDFERGLLSKINLPNQNFKLCRNAKKSIEAVEIKSDGKSHLFQLNNPVPLPSFHQQLKKITSKESKSRHKISASIFENTYTVFDAIYDAWNYFFGENETTIEEETTDDESFDPLKNFLDFENHFYQTFYEPFEYFMSRILGDTFAFIGGFSVEEMVEGQYGEGIELPHLRLSAINGILNSHESCKKLVAHISNAHNGYPVHYLYAPTHGFSTDMFKALEGKMEIHSERSKQLSQLWIKLIDQMYEQIEDHKEPTLIHFAHSLGGLDTYLASFHIDDTLKSHIRVNTFGSARLINSSAGFQSIKNYICYRDIVPVTDLIHYIIHLIRQDDDTIFVGDFFGIPFVDHFFFNGTYEHVAMDIAQEVLEEFGLN